MSIKHEGPPGPYNINWHKQDMAASGVCKHKMLSVTCEWVRCHVCEREVFKDELRPGSHEWQFAKERPDDEVAESVT